LTKSFLPNKNFHEKMKRGNQLYMERYPGLQPFDKGQSTIFFGRDMEKKELFYQVCLEKVVVLFGKSGLGKSSLLNAGVSPQLEEKGFLPITVRFSPPKKKDVEGEKENGNYKKNNPENNTDADEENLLIRDFIISFKGFNFKKKILYNGQDPKLWEYVKATPFNEIVEKDQTPVLWDYIQRTKETKKNNEPVTVIPVFIFDQFEQFFYHTVKHQQEFLSQLAEIVHDETPYRILEWITNIDYEKRTREQIDWHQPPAVKLIFALRSDKLANMQSVVPFIPSMLRNRYELKPLTNSQAMDAIRQPALKDLGPDYGPTFTYEPDTLNKIVTELSSGSNEIESSQLQIVCHFIENKLKGTLEATGSSSIPEVNDSIINPPKDFPEILDNFYETQLALIKDEASRNIARILIEDELVVDNQRDSISERKLLNTLNIKKELITELSNTRLIREENTNRGAIYELSHDTLVAPVVKSKKKRKLEEDRKKREEEKNLLAEEATKKDEELKERYKQLINEIQLKEEAQLQKEEAQQQKAEVERLSRKLKSKSRSVFILGFIFFIGILLISWLTLINARRHLKTTRKELINEINNSLDDALTITIDSTYENVTANTNDSIKATVLTLIDNADSISQYTDTEKDPVIDSLIDTYYKNDFTKEKINTKKLSTSEKIETLKKILPRYEQFKVKMELNDKPVQLEKVKSFKE
jgi:hypothetical protein